MSLAHFRIRPQCKPVPFTAKRYRVQAYTVPPSGNIKIGAVAQGLDELSYTALAFCRSKIGTETGGLRLPLGIRLLETPRGRSLKTPSSWLIHLNRGL